MSKPIIISMINGKGGVAKTSTSINTGAALTNIGKKVLLVDFDKSKSLTHYLVDEDKVINGVADLLLDAELTIKDSILKTKTDNLHVLPATKTSKDFVISVANEEEKEFLLKALLECDEFNSYDYIIIDNGPNFDLLCINSLVASDYYVTPCSAEYMALQGLSEFIDTVEEVKGFNPELQYLGLVITMFNARETASKKSKEIILDNFASEAFDSMIRVNTKLKQCPIFQKTIFEYAKGNDKGCQDYMKLAFEIEGRINAATR